MAKIIKEELIRETECSPYIDNQVEDVISIISIDYDNKETVYILKHKDEIILECRGKRASTAIYDYYEKYYKIYKHFLYPNTAFKCKNMTREVFKQNCKIYEEIEKKYSYITDKESRLKNCILAYEKDSRVK